MKKKVKKIPKYNGGGTISPDVLNKSMEGRFNAPTQFGKQQPMASMAQHSHATVGLSKDNSAAAGGSGFGGNWGAFNAAATAGGKMLMDAFGVEDNSQAGVTLNTSMQGAEIGGSIVPGWGHLVGGIAGGAIGAFKKGSVDVNTGEITYGGIFGRSKDSLLAESDMIKDNIRATQMTEQKKAEYAMNINNPNGGSIMAAEGGIVSGEHYASRGEVEVAADGTNAVRYGWDNNGKDTYHVYTNPDGSSAVGNMVFTEEGVKRPNGEKYSDAAEKIIKGTKEGSKLRQISLRRLANEMEEQKMNKDIKQIKNGIPAHEKGIYYVDGQRAEYRHGSWWWNEGGKKDARGKMYFVPYTGKSTPSETEPIKYTSETPVGPLDPAYRQHVRYSSTNDTERKATVNKPSSSKKIAASRVTTSTAPSPEDTVLRRPKRVYDYEEPAKAITAPVDDKKVYGRDGSVRYDYTTPERKVTTGDLGRPNGNDKFTGSNWKDNLYRMAVLSQLLWDRAKAEPVNYESPVYKYMPTAIDVLSQLRDTDQSYALARYNFANLYPNTGAGMAAGLQAASNRAKQLADIRQYQTNAQNELIGKNVGIYNNWANEHARIMNDVYNKTAANRAAARNINRQNRAAALSNYGQMLRDDKQFAMDTMKLQMMEPMMQYGYENYNDYLNWKKANGYG